MPNRSVKKRRGRGRGRSRSRNAHRGRGISRSRSMKGGSRGSYGSSNMYGGPTMDSSFSSLGSAPFKNTLSLEQTKMNF